MLDSTKLILEHMDMAEKIAWKYAHRNGVHKDEAVAEAYYLLCELFIENPHVYLAKPSIKTVGMFVKTRLVNYFTRRVKKFDPIVEDKIAQNTDEEMLEYLSDIFSDDIKAFAVFDFIRGGLSFDEVMVICPELTRVTKRIKMQVSGRLFRIEKMNEMGIKSVREVKSDPAVAAAVLAEMSYEEELKSKPKVPSPSALTENPPTTSA